MSQLHKIASQFNKSKFMALTAELSFDEYLELLHKTPKLLRTSFQMIYDMIMSKGTAEFERYRKKSIHYNFFDDPEVPVIGLEDMKSELVKFVRGAAGHYGTEKRVLLLHGPVGSSKSTILRLLKRSMERYSATDDGAWYTFKWVNLPEDFYTAEFDECPMHEQPLKLLPFELRQTILQDLNEIHRDQQSQVENGVLYDLRCEGELDPRCRLFMRELLKRHEGDLEKVLSGHIKVIRKLYSESDRCGIATFQPKDEKNQDSTELTGDINFQLISKFGSDSDPRCFNFDGEFNIANRGIIEFIEVLKLDVAFLYDLLGASQEHNIKPKKFAQIEIDEAIFCHTNGAEFLKLQANNYMEALRDRTVKIDVAYTLDWSDEIKILEKDYGSKKVRAHVAPHTLEIAALWAVLTRLHEAKDGKLTLVQKAELYDGKLLPGWNEDAVKEMRDKAVAEGEGLDVGVSARYVQDVLSVCLSSNRNYVNFFTVLNELKKGLNNSPLITNKELITKYAQCVDMAEKKLTEILTAEVQKALVGDESAMTRLCANYIDNVMAYNSDTKVLNKITNREEKVNEQLMRSVEEKIDIPETHARNFRLMIAGSMGDLSHKGKRFQWDSNPQLKKAFEQKLFEDTRHQIKFSTLSSTGATVVDPEIQKKIDALKTRLIKQYGYNDQSATDVLEFVSAIFARGQLQDDS